MYENILVPSDGSKGASGAVEHALGIAAEYGATVHGLYVIEPVYAVETRTEKLVDAMRAEGKRAVAEVAEMADDRGLESVTAVRTGPPHTELLDYAAEHDIDLIVMGTHGRTGLNRFLLGSVTEKVVRLSDVPVLTVRAGDEA